MWGFSVLFFVQFWGEDFLSWPSAQPEMGSNRHKLPPKQPLQPRCREGSSDDDSPREVGGRNRSTSEQRLKRRNDPSRVDRRAKQRGKAVASTPPLKKRARYLPEVEARREEEEASDEDSKDESDDR